jgi:4-hydroxy-3-methylbut-2-en-1-yl diphosphate synthase IspG/GcpE
MALHVPVHHAGITGDHLFRNFMLAVGLAIALIVVVGIAMTIRVSVAPEVTPVEQAQSLVQYRAAERADWAAGVPTRASSLVQHRAAERADWAAGRMTEAQSLVQFRAAEREGR